MSDIRHHSGSRFLVHALAARGLNLDETSMLIVGCGDGVEVQNLRSAVGRITATDIRLDENLQSDSQVRYLECAAEEISAKDGSHDTVFCYHVLEHVTDPEKTLSEMRRVLNPSGRLFIGVPNRHRVLGYMGGRGASLRQKARWNVADYRARLSGKFRNEFGQHAGFSRAELEGLLRVHFPFVEWVTADYLEFKYPWLPEPLAKGFSCIAPAIYAIAWCRQSLPAVQGQSSRSQV